MLNLRTLSRDLLNRGAKLTSRGRRDLEKRSTASGPVTKPSRSESYIGKMLSYFDFSCADMAYGSEGTEFACPAAEPECEIPFETHPGGGGGTFCILAKGRRTPLSAASRSEEIGIPGEV